MKEFHFYNKYHLGDCAISVHFLRKFTENKTYRTFFYCDDKYHKELSAHIPDKLDQIILKNLDDRPADSWNHWYGSLNLNNHGRDKRIFNINERYDMFFQIFCKNNKIENPLAHLGKNGTLFDNPQIRKETGLKCDLLFINSRPLSSQYAFNKKDMRYFAEKMSEKYKMITTAKLSDSMECTMDHNLNLMGIANLSLTVKYLVGVATAPIIPCFNIWNIDNLKKLIVLSSRSTYTYNENILRLSNINDFQDNMLE